MPSQHQSCVCFQPKHSPHKGYDYTRAASRERPTLRHRTALFVLMPPGGGSPRAALERLVADTLARVRVTLAEVHGAGAEELEQHYCAELRATLANDAGGPDAVA